jgi:hypothetical protein
MCTLQAAVQSWVMGLAFLSWLTIALAAVHTHATISSFQNNTSAAAGSGIYQPCTTTAAAAMCA